MKAELYKIIEDDIPFETNDLNALIALSRKLKLAAHLSRHVQDLIDEKIMGIIERALLASGFVFDREMLHMTECTEGSETLAGMLDIIDAEVKVVDESTRLVSPSKFLLGIVRKDNGK